MMVTLSGTEVCLCVCGGWGVDCGGWLCGVTCMERGSGCAECPAVRDAACAVACPVDLWGHVEWMLGGEMRCKLLCV